jgi:hypothetical protein
MWLCLGAGGSTAGVDAEAVSALGPVGIAPAAVPGELIVAFERRLPARDRARALARVGAVAKKQFRHIDAVLATVRAGERSRAIQALRRDGRVRYAEPNFLLRASAHSGTPDDPSFHSLWGLENFGQTVNGVPGIADADIDAAEAWGVTTGDPEVVVAVIDTGVDYDHPDLAANIWLNPGETCTGCRTDRVDNDGNGFVDDVRGWDFANEDSNPFDDHGHGTHVAGTIGAIGNNGIGVAGVSWAVRLMPLKFLGADGSGATADAIRAVLYAVDEGAVVSNNSYGGDGFSQAFADAIAYADAQGSLFIASAGNSLSNIDVTPTYPASYDFPNVITVAATDSADRKAWFSNYGRRSVELGAPGDNIYSTVPGNGYEYLSGTSMASPHVAGAAAIAKAAFPAASGVGVKALLLRTVDANASLDQQTATGGRLNVDSAVRCSGTPQVWIESPAAGFVAALGQPVTVTAIAAACGDPSGVAVTATGNGEPITLTPRGDGVYNGQYTPSSEGPLSITVTAEAGGSSDVRTALGTVPKSIAPGGAPVTVATTAPGEDVLLAFAGTAGQRVSLKLSAVSIGTSSCCSAKVSILRPDGSALAAPAYFGTSGGFVDTRTLSATGVYRILVDPQGTATGSVTLTLYDVPVDGSAAIAAGGGAVTLSTTIPGQNLQATFTGVAGQRVSLRLTEVTIGTSTCCGGKVSISAPDGSTLAAPAYFGTGGGFVDVKTLTASGTYTILVDPLGTATGSATLTLYDVPADASATTSPGSSGPSVTTTVPGQNARVTFAGVAGQRVSIRVSGMTLSGAHVSVLNPDGSTLASPIYVGTSGGFVDTRTLPSAGTHAVVVDPQGIATGSATVTVYDVPPDPTATGSPGGPSVSVTTTVPGQNAKVTFAGTAGLRVSVRLTSVTMSSARVSIMNPDGSTLAAPAYFGTSGGFIDAKTLTASGTHSILVDPTGTATGSMTLTLYDVPPDASATASIGGPAVTVATTVPGQNARVSFGGSGGQTVTIVVSGVTVTLSTVSVLRPDGSTLVAPSYMTSSGKTISVQLPSPGTYGVVLNPNAAHVGSFTVGVT